MGFPGDREVLIALCKILVTFVFIIKESKVLKNEGLQNSGPATCIYWLTSVPHMQFSMPKKFVKLSNFLPAEKIVSLEHFWMEKNSILISRFLTWLFKHQGDFLGILCMFLARTKEIHRLLWNQNNQFSAGIQQFVFGKFSFENFAFSQELDFLQNQ